MAELMTVVENDDYLILPMRNHQVAGRKRGVAQRSGPTVAHQVSTMSSS
jgi:hypothetical protein